MALVNRDKDASEQRDVYQTSLEVTASGVSAGIANPGVLTGNTFPLFTATRPGQLVAVAAACWGISGTPNHSLWLYRFAGGFASIQMGNSLAPLAFGTSGTVSHSLMPASISYPLVAGDQVVLKADGANTAFAKVMMTCVVKALQDIKTDFGV